MLRNPLYESLVSTYERNYDMVPKSDWETAILCDYFTVAIRYGDTRFIAALTNQKMFFDLFVAIYGDSYESVTKEQWSNLPLDRFRVLATQCGVYDLITVMNRLQNEA